MLNVLLAVAFHAVVPFTLVDNRIVVNAAVNGRPGFSMIVDTGAHGILLTPQDVAALHLSTKPAPRVTGAGAGKSAARLARVDSVAIGAYRIPGQTAVVISLERIRKAFHFPRLNGVIGFDELGGRYVGIDMTARTLTVSSTPIAVPKNAKTTAYAISDGLMTADGAIDGVNGPVVIDTGDRSNFTVFTPFAKRNNFYDVPMLQRNAVTGIGVGGQIRGDLFYSTVSALGFDVPDVVTRAPVGPSGAFDSSGQIGSLGEGVMRRYNLVFDARAQTIAAWPAAAVPVQGQVAHVDAASLPRHATFGAALENRGGGASVSRVIPGSPAAAAGLAAGDVVTSLAGVATPDVAAFLSQIHRLHAGARVDVAFRRGGASHRVNVVLGAPANESDPRLVTIYGAVTVDGTLRRTLLTMPKNAQGRLPAMLLIGGIGCYTVDAAANPQDAYTRFAHDVSAAGFVTMRIEKSGIGDSQGPPCVSVDFDAERRGYAAALAALKADPHVDASRVYLFGHSIGSLQAPLLARTSPVAGVITAEAVGRDWMEYEVRNVRRQLELTGEKPVNVDAQVAAKEVCMVRLLALNEPEAEIERAKPECKDQNGVYPVDPPYMRQVVRVNGIAQWAALDVPVLAIYGDSDFVTEKADHERIVDVVNAHHPGSATFTEIPGMDHLLFTAATPKAAMDALTATTPRTYDTDLSAAVVKWLCSRERCSA